MKDLINLIVRETANEAAKHNGNQIVYVDRIVYRDRPAQAKRLKPTTKKQTSISDDGYYAEDGGIAIMR